MRNIMYYVNDLNNIVPNTHFGLSFFRHDRACEAMGVASAVKSTKNRSLILLINPT